MKNILVVGIGGVGGYFGGMLAKHNEDKPNTNVYFLARGENAEAIKQYGLQVKVGDELFLTHPRKVYSSLQAADKMDFVLVCTKSYHLQQVIPEIKKCITEQTLIMPLLNGVEPAIALQAAFPTNLVASGCTYLVSQLTHPGKVDNSGAIQQIYFGIQNQKDARLSELLQIFQSAKINAEVSTNIATVVWEKYIFIAAIAATTSFYDCTIGAVLEDDQGYKILLQLLNEVTTLALAKGIVLPKTTVQTTEQKIQDLPYAGTSSMHRDFAKGKETELENLIGYILREAKVLGIEVPGFTAIYAKLSKS